MSGVAALGSVAAVRVYAALQDDVALQAIAAPGGALHYTLDCGASKHLICIAFDAAVVECLFETPVSNTDTAPSNRTGIGWTREPFANQYYSAE